MAEAAEEKGKSPSEWIKKITSRQKQLKKHWLDDAKKVYALYEAAKPAEVPFNILYSNTETILPALYNSTPRPEVSRRFISRDPQQRIQDMIVAQATERLLEYSADSNNNEYETFSETVKAALLDALLPGLGQARIRFHQDGGYQAVCYESVPYDRFLWGYARKWRSVPWVAYGHDMTREEFEKQFPEFAKGREYTTFDWTTAESESDDLEQGDAEEQKKNRGLLVWEVWDPTRREVLFLCETFKASLLLSEPYPTRLSGKFPSPPPLVFLRKGKQALPVPVYRVYQEQAEALNVLARRERRLARAIRVRGIYNSAHSELQTIFNQDDDNILIPSESSAAFQDGGLERSIWMLPIDMIASTLREVQNSMASAKQTIYEIMGIGDILRGASNPEETARAQEIKNQWGGLRIKKSQKDVQEFCRELFRIALEFSASYYTPATLAGVTQLPLLFAAQKQEMQKEAQAAQQRAMMQAQMAQAQGQQAPPPQMPPPDPRLQLPSWEDLLKVLQDGLQRTYRIDIETNSTVDLEATEDKQSIAEFMNAFGQMMSGITPLLEQGVADFEFAKVMILEVARRFRFGRRMEDALEQLHAPAPQDDGEAAKQQAQLEIKTAQSNAASAVEQMRKQLTEMAGALEKKEIELTGLRQTQQLDQKAVEVKFGQQGLDHKAQQFQAKTDYQGKITMAKQQNDQTQQQLASKELQGLQQQIAAMIDGWRQEVAAGDEKRKLEQEKAAAEEKDDEGLRPMVEQLAAGQMALQEAMVGLAKEVKEVARLAGAERESELIIGPDGKKRARSRILQ